VLGTVAANRLLTAMLHEVRPMDGLTLAAVTGFLLAISAIASAIPAWSSTRIDAAIALRAEG
jgi:ABC-type lipoprotein release transport system permease subunit